MTQLVSEQRRASRVRGGGRGRATDGPRAAVGIRERGVAARAGASEGEARGLGHLQWADPFMCLNLSNSVRLSQPADTKIPDIRLGRGCIHVRAALPDEARFPASS
jgi:hypothetical protein